MLTDDSKKVEDSLCLFSYAAYEKKACRNLNFRLRAGGGNGNEVLIRWNEIYKYQPLFIEKFGNPKTAHNPMEDFFEIDGLASVWFGQYLLKDDSHIKIEQQSQYTLNASVLNALQKLYVNRTTMRKQRGNSTRGVWQSCVNDCNLFNEVLKTKYNAQHTLPRNERRLAEALKQYKIESYEYLVDNRAKNQNAAKVKDTVQTATIEQLLRKHNNFDNEQIATYYNSIAVKMEWETITAATIANYRREFGLFIYGDSKGLSKFGNKKAMQIKRSAPTASMAYWTMDGWDVELLYQKIDTKNGGNVTTYHNRPAVVVVMDPVAGIKYPIGYAIGTHETPELIQEALRNAANHTRDLFGNRYKPLQLQSDRYAIKTLTPLYEAMTKHFTPARAHNAKSKAIEPYFLHINKQCQMLYPNWSGFGITSNKDLQPNAEKLNQIRHSFPDFEGVKQQVIQLMELERSKKVSQYMAYWEMMPNEARLPMDKKEYLMLFGSTHQWTNRIQGAGLIVTIGGQSLTFDSFDPRFRELGHVDWVVKYDPQDLSSVLVLNGKADSATRKVKEIIGTQRFELTSKYIQPMALYDRKEGDALELARVAEYNKQLGQDIINRGNKTKQEVERLFTENPQLNGTLAKLLLVDSNGQHKNNRNEGRALPEAPKQINEETETSGEYEILDDDFRSEYGLTD
jgi:hypothetical protein